MTRRLLWAWGWVVFAVRFEVALYVALTRWLLRRPDVPAGATPWGYARLVTPVLWLWIFGSATEVVVVHVITPWTGVRLTLLVIGIWGLVWMLGLLASYRVYPHLADATGLRVRLGKHADVLVPWTAITSAAAVDRDLPSTLRTFQPRETAAGVDLQVGVSGRCNVTIRLSEPVTVEVKGEPLDVTAVTVHADEPRALVAAVRSRLVATG